MWQWVKNRYHCGEQGSYVSSVAKFPDFSSHERTISLTLWKQKTYHTNVRNGTLYHKVMTVL